jgi:hypothetical protein
LVRAALAASLRNQGQRRGAREDLQSHFEMPDITLQIMIGAITILISLMKPSLIALIQSLVA